MNDGNPTRLVALLLLAAMLACGRDEHGRDEEAHEGAEAFARGPHGGRWLEDEAGFALELAIFEEVGVPPELRAFAYRDEKPIDPATVQLEATLRRLGGRVEQVRFAPSSADGDMRGALAAAEDIVKRLEKECTSVPPAAEARA